MRYWTTSEERLLRETYPNTPMSVLTTTLNRPVGSIHAKAKSMGIQRSEEFKAGEHGGRVRKGSTLGVHTQFQKGYNRYAPKSKPQAGSAHA